MSGRPKIAWIGPAVASVLAFFVFAVGLDVLTAERVDRYQEMSAQSLATEVARAPGKASSSRAENIDIAVIGDYPEPRKYRYLHALYFVDHSTDAGQTLETPDDRDYAEAWRRGRRGPSSWTSGDEVVAVAPSAGNRVVRVSVKPLVVPVGDLWAVVGLGTLLLLGLWCWFLKSGPLTPRRTALLGPSAIALLLLAGLMVGLNRVDSVTSGSEGASELFALTTVICLPLVWIAVYGYVRSATPSPHRLAFTYVAPAILGLGVLVMLPFLFGILLAFFRFDGEHFSWVGLQHFIDILSSKEYPITHPLSFYFTLAFTILWTGLNVLLHVTIGLALALLLNRPDLEFKGVYRVLLIIPWAVPSYITALIWKGMFNQQFGLINAVLGYVGVEPIGWFSGFWTAFIANLSTNTWLGFPFMMVVALGALQSIPRDLYEAARVDGANAWQQFRLITLPLLRPALLPAVIMGTVWTFNMFNIVYLVSGGRPGGATDI